ncbi:DMT family transporter [Vibrio viridaestus]|uniref:EamA domain-containing protein n=1 Tax=Vibrio viridaestus TaxID=2487322 RepID=A0A3N9TDZ7_9VIBR|nr:DMT family transporter [Vibrio viridaestus]RQW62309.1 hypothetical protein EES38_14105 [Vibrio viridaestus]
MNKGYLYIAGSTLLFSSMEIAIKLVSSEYNPMQLNLLRFIIGAIILAPLAIKSLRKTNFKFTKESVHFLAMSGFLCVVVSMTFFQLAIMYTKASTVAILFSCNAVFVIPFAYILLKENITPLTIISLLFSIVGILFIVNPMNLTNVAGIVCALISAVSFALYGVFGHRGRNRFGLTGVSLTCLSFVAGSAELLVLMWISEIPFVANWLTADGLSIFADMPIIEGLSMHSIPSLVYLGIFVTGLGFCFYFLAMEETSASTASMVFFIKPALAPILALIVLSEGLTENVIAGILLILVGSMVTYVNDTKRNKAKLALATATGNVE